MPVTDSDDGDDEEEEEDAGEVQGEMHQQAC
jgi:hypothetical protein